MDFSYNLVMNKSRQIIIATFAPLILAGVVVIVKYLLLEDSIAVDESGISFGLYGDYVVNPLLIPTLESVLDTMFYGLLALAAFLPSLIFLRNQPIERTELNLGGK
jgi:hypothetical protein